MPERAFPADDLRNTIDLFLEEILQLHYVRCSIVCVKSQCCNTEGKLLGKGWAISLHNTLKQVDLTHPHLLTHPRTRTAPRACTWSAQRHSGATWRFLAIPQPTVSFRTFAVSWHYRLFCWWASWKSGDMSGVREPCCHPALVIFCQWISRC